MTSIIIQPADIWTAAGVLLGFQVTSFIWRIDREVKIRDARDAAQQTLHLLDDASHVTDDLRLQIIAAAQQTLHQGGPWLTPSDFVNIISMIVVVVGVFVLPILGLANSTFLKDSFGLATLLFIGHAFARAGHYRLYTRPVSALGDRLQNILGKIKNDSTSDQSAVPRLINRLLQLIWGQNKSLYYPRQERMVIIIIIMLVIAYMIIAIIKR